MNGKKNGKNRSDITGAFAPLPITQPDRRHPGSNAAIPSDSNVKEAKDWVDFNKK